MLIYISVLDEKNLLSVNILLVFRFDNFFYVASINLYKHFPSKLSKSVIVNADVI